MPAQIGQIALTVSDVDRAVAFYREVLQLPFLFQFPGLAFFDCQGVRLMLTRPEGTDQTIANSTLYFKVDNIQAEAQALTFRGIKLEGDPHMIAKLPDHELWMAFFRDPDNNLLALMSEVR
jgi:methylmalonyl-CoA/ethylmalonyl-CoA epimerase